jgi:DNA-directed RNA polymerase specialized sigma24 family protein
LINYKRELAIAILVAQGDNGQWNRCLAEVKKILNTWCTRAFVDYELEIVEAIWAAAKSYRPRKMRFVNWASFVAKRRCIDKFRSFKGRSRFWCQEGETYDSHVVQRNHHHVRSSDAEVIYCEEEISCP